MLNQLWIEGGINRFQEGQGKLYKQEGSCLEHSFATRDDERHLVWGITMPQRGTLVRGLESGECVWKKRGEKQSPNWPGNYDLLAVVNRPSSST